MQRDGVVPNMRRWARVCKPSQTGIWRRNPHRTLMPISASTGTGQTSGSDALAGSPAPDRRGAPAITLLDGTFLATDVPSTALLRALQRFEGCSKVRYLASHG